MLIFPEHEGCKPQIKKDGKPTAEGEEKTAGREDPELAEGDTGQSVSTSH